MRHRSNPQIALKPQDLVVLLKLLVLGNQRRTFAELASDLGMSASEVHGSVGRTIEARLVHVSDDHLHVSKAALKDFVLHGARYVFPPVYGAVTRGIPTAHAAPPLSERLNQSTTEPMPVWPTPQGTQRGLALYPLYPSVPKAVDRDPKLYQMLALFDALRGGAARERQLASQLLEEQFA
jgi:hypothetical protein